MTWINYVPFDKATGRLKSLYEKYMRANETVANIVSAHSLRPHMLEGHMAFYRAVLGHSANTLPLWFLEAVGVYVSSLNGCNYCIDHHGHFGELAFEGGADEWKILSNALTSDEPEKAFNGKHLALLGYAKQVTETPKSLTADIIDDLRRAGVDDGEILEVNQVCGYFAYANRTVLGLGISLKGEVYVD